MHTTESRSERAIERLRSELAAVLSGQADTSSSRIRRRVAGCLNQIAADDLDLEDELRRRASTVERLTGVDTAFHRTRTRCEFLRGIIQELPGRLAALDEKEAKDRQEQNGPPRHEVQDEVRSYEALMRLPLRAVKILDDKPVGEGERAPYNQNELEGLATDLEKLLRIEFGFSDAQRAALAQWREETISVVQNAEDAHAEGCFHLLIIWLAESTLSSDTSWAAQADRIVSNRDCLQEMLEAVTDLCISARPPTEQAATTGPLAPTKYLLNWREILDALDQKSNDQSRRAVRELNERFAGPIVFGGKGTQPRVAEEALLAWWNGLEDRFRDCEQRNRDKEATVRNQHPFGREGTVVPDIGGGVRRSRSKPQKRSRKVE